MAVVSDKLNVIGSPVEITTSAFICNDTFPRSVEIRVRGLITASALTVIPIPLLFKVVLRPNPVTETLIFDTPSTVTVPRVEDISSPTG